MQAMSLVGLMDCNNFFVSCERLFRPDLATKPVAVLSSNDGVIVARSAEVKALGVPMGIPLFQAKQLVDMSQVTLFSSNFALYRDISRRVMRVLASEVGECEVYSIDEAFFKVGANPSKENIVTLRERIMQKTGIPITIGVASTKTLAKQASRFGKKEDGVVILGDKSWRLAAANTSITEVWGLGQATATSLRQLGVTEARSFMQLPRQFVQNRYGVAGLSVQAELLGQRVHEVETNSATIRQSIASTRSFANNEFKLTVLESALSYHVTEVAEKLRAKGLLAGTIKVEALTSRHSNFANIGGVRVVTLTEPSQETVILLKQALQTLKGLYKTAVPYKKIGFAVGALLPVTASTQNLFRGREVNEKKIDTVVDRLNLRFGHGTIKSATILDNPTRNRTNLRSPHYTTLWRDIPTIRTD